MALAIGVNLGDKVYIDDVPMEVVALKGYESAMLSIGSKTFKVDDQSMREVLPHVFVSCGRPSPSAMQSHGTAYQKAMMEWERRNKMLESGQITQAEFKALPRLDLSPALLPRLLIDAPRSIRILRGELYERQSVRFNEARAR